MRAAEPNPRAEEPENLLAEAAREVDRTLIQLAMSRSLRERLRAGVAMSRLAARFHREEALIATLEERSRQPKG
jgi:hypothetical protein